MKNLLLFFASLALASCISEEVWVGGGGEINNPPATGDGTFTITIPGGFSVAGTRGLTDAQEMDIDQLTMLLFDADPDTGVVGQLVSAQGIESSAITPGADPNKYNVRITLPQGSHKVVLIANSADLDVKVENQVGEVLVGSVYWAKTDAIGNGRFAASETAYNNVQFNWHEATTGVIGATSGGISGTNVQGICPPGWRLPTNTEFAALMAASTNFSTAGKSGNLTNGGYYTSNPGWNGTAPANMSVVTANGTLIFPASGYSDGGTDQGSYGYFWSSVEGPSNAAGAYRLYFESGIVIPGEFTNKTLAHSVRCVRQAEPVANPVGEVTVGNLIWAKTDAIGGNQFAVSETAYNNVQFTWAEAMNGAPSGTNVQGICPTGWRLPTPTEFYALMAASTNKGSTSGTMTPSGGGYYTSNPGWSGTSPAKMSVITANGTLIFPASGYSDGGVGQGSSGYFWSSVENPSNTSYADYLGFSSSVVSPAGDGSKADAFSVRCVRNVSATRAFASAAQPSTRAGVTDVAKGDSYADVMAALTGTINSKLYTSGGAIPMWGEVDNVTTGTDNDIEIDLHRALARVDVEVAAAVTNFVMTEVVVGRPNNKYSLFSDLSLLGTGANEDVFADPTIPNGAAQLSLADSKSLFTYSGSEFVRQIYVPEAVVATKPHDEQMALLIGGKFNGGATTWYRADFRSADGLVDVIRNHRYTFTVSSVGGPGRPDIEDAWNTTLTNMTVSVVDWNDVDIPIDLR